MSIPAQLTCHSRLHRLNCSLAGLVARHCALAWAVPAAVDAPATWPAAADAARCCCWRRACVAPLALALSRSPRCPAIRANANSDVACGSRLRRHLVPDAAWSWHAAASLPTLTGCGDSHATAAVDCDPNCRRSASASSGPKVDDVCAKEMQQGRQRGSE